MIRHMMKFLTMRGLSSLIGKRLHRLFQQDLNAIKIRIGQQTLLSSKLIRESFEKLSDAEVTVFSQWGEDGILDYLCDVTSLERPNILELGAGNFEECNSRFLIENRFANSVLVDARGDLLETVKQDGVFWKTHLLAVNSWITPETMRGIQETAQDFLGRIDILSIDIDGNDYWVMKEFDFSETLIVVAEYNPIFGAKYPVTIPRNDSFVRSEAHFSNLYYGVGLRAWVNLLAKEGFSLVGTNKVGSNAFFIRSNLVSKLDFVPNAELDSYINWGVRESRSRDGNLNFLSGAQRKAEISNLPLVNVETSELLEVGSTL